MESSFASQSVQEGIESRLGRKQCEPLASSASGLTGDYIRFAETLSVSARFDVDQIGLVWYASTLADVETSYCKAPDSLNLSEAAERRNT